MRKSINFRLGFLFSLSLFLSFESALQKLSHLDESEAHERNVGLGGLRGRVGHLTSEGRGMRKSRFSRLSQEGTKKNCDCLNDARGPTHFSLFRSLARAFFSRAFARCPCPPCLLPLRLLATRGERSLSLARCAQPWAFAPSRWRRPRWR